MNRSHHKKKHRKKINRGFRNNKHVHKNVDNLQIIPNDIQKNVLTSIIKPTTKKKRSIKKITIDKLKQENIYLKKLKNVIRNIILTLISTGNILIAQKLLEKLLFNKTKNVSNSQRKEHSINSENSESEESDLDIESDTESDIEFNNSLEQIEKSVNDKLNNDVVKSWASINSEESKPKKLSKSNILKKFKLNKEGSYSITKPHEAYEIYTSMRQFIRDHILNNKTITDGSACMGGDLVNFSKYFHYVNGVEINPVNFNLLKQNIKTFGCKNIKLFNEDYTKIYKNIKQDVIYIDPPWGGPDYKIDDVVYLKFGNYNLWDFIRNIINQKITKYIFIKVPFNAEKFHDKSPNFYKETHVIFNESRDPVFNLICIRIL
jgi:predicted RNA methylase